MRESGAGSYPSPLKLAPLNIRTKGRVRGGASRRPRVKSKSTAMNRTRSSWNFHLTQAAVQNCATQKLRIMEDPQPIESKT